LAAALLASAAVAAFAPLFAILVDQWMTNDTYSFGVLVPFISAYFVWMQRARLVAIRIEPDPWGGALLVAACAALMAFGRAFGVIGIQEIAMTLTLPAMLWLLFGRRLVFALWFPLLYLFLMLPVWEILTDRFHYRSQLFSAQLGEELLSLAGVPVRRNGTYLELPNITLEVASVCSGVNFLIAVVAIGVPQAYLLLSGFLPRASVIAFAVSIALFSNGLRIAIIGWLSHHDLTANIHGPGHLLQGLFVSTAGIIALQTAILYMARRFPRRASTAARPSTDPPMPRSHWRITAAATAVAVLLLATAHLRPATLLASTISPDDDSSGAPPQWQQLGPPLPMPFVAGQPGHELGRSYETADGRIVQLFVADLAYASHDGGFAYRRVSLPTRAASSEIPITTARGDVFVNSVSFRDGDRTIDVLYWYDLQCGITSHVSVAKLRSVWRLIAGGRPLPLLVILTSHRSATEASARVADGPTRQIIDALDVRCQGA
jgi:exosortase